MIGRRIGGMLPSGITVNASLARKAMDITAERVAHALLVYGDGKGGAQTPPPAKPHRPLDRAPRR